MTINNEKFVQFAENSDGKVSEIISEIIVDTADELPETGGISGRILHQGSSALIVKEGRIAVLSGDGEWCDISGKTVEKLIAGTEDGND